MNYWHLKSRPSKLKNPVVTFIPHIKQMWKDNRAQAGGISTLILGIMVLGFFYVMFSQFMGNINTANDNFMDSGAEYSQDHWTATDNLNKFWWGVPLFFVILFVIFGIKNALSREDTEI